ncbi:relaxase/mobilization nuclease domain-containing protein [Desulfosarcina cetonica]
MAKHLLKSDQNEHVKVHEVSGFIASDVLGALNEAYALSKGTKCKQFMYALSLSPPQNEKVPVAVFENALERIEKKLGLEGQPRVVVFHEKEGRRHAHCVWSRIDTENMKAINISHPKLKLKDIAISLYKEHGWKMPEGFRDKSKKNPLNYSRAEWQQALRIGRKPDDIKRELQECWVVSDSRAGFESALQEIGYTLAQGDRRGFVAVDVHGEVYSLTRQLGQKKKELADRLGSPDDLPSVSDVQTTMKGRLSKLFKGFADELQLQHELKSKPLKKDKEDMVERHRSDRSRLDEVQQKRWQSEELKRSARIRSGFKGLWDKINGRYWKNRKRNEREAWLAYQRDQKEQEDLISAQLRERRNLQAQIRLLREKQEEERKALLRDLSHAQGMEAGKDRQNREKSRQAASRPKKMPKSELEFEGLDLDIDNDLEPEI